MTLADLHISTVEASYVRIRGLIMEAELLPNTHHLELALAEQLFLEPEDIHDAAVQLEHEGLVQLEPRGGFWVVPLNGKDVRDLYGQISALEARAAFLAAANGPSPLDLSTLDEAIATMNDALYRNDHQGWAHADYHFHRSLVQCSNHPPLIAAALPLSEPVHRVRMVTLALRPPLFDAAQSHAQIVDAIRRTAADEAHNQHVAYWQEATNMVSDLVRVHGLDRYAMG